MSIHGESVLCYSLFVLLQMEVEMRALALTLWLILAGNSTAAQYETILEQPLETQQALLAFAVQSVGEPCPVVTRFMFRGVDANQAGYWTARCSTGRDWGIQVKNDAGGTASVLSCAVMKMLGQRCWSTLWPAPPAGDVRRAQTMLTALGYHPGAVDGVMGPASRMALMRFQADHSLRTDGRLSTSMYALNQVFTKRVLTAAAEGRK